MPRLAAPPATNAAALQPAARPSCPRGRPTSRPQRTGPTGRARGGGRARPPETPSRPARGPQRAPPAPNSM
eukprot:8423922-Lingulodinium_polyedra.AAC.1